MKEESRDYPVEGEYLCVIFEDLKGGIYHLESSSLEIVPSW